MRYRTTTVEIDMDELARAKAVLGTQTVKETVNGALREVNRRAALAYAAHYVQSGDLRVPDAATLSAWRQPRHNR